MALCGYPAGMTDQQVVFRTGRGVPAGRPPTNRKLRPATYWVLAAAVLIAVSALIVTMYVPPESEPAPVATSAIDNRVECANITHAYNQWWPGRERLDVLPYVDPMVAEMFLKTLNEDAQAFSDASRGYADYLSKDLTLAVLELREQLSMLQFQQRVQHTVDEALLKKTQAAWDSAGEKYRAFTEGSC